jgi:hypothetical protein
MVGGGISVSADAVPRSDDHPIPILLRMLIKLHDRVQQITKALVEEPDVPPLLNLNLVCGF